MNHLLLSLILGIGIIAPVCAMDTPQTIQSPVYSQESRSLVGTQSGDEEFKQISAASKDKVFVDKPLTVIDSNGQRHTFTLEESTDLLQCKLLKGCREDCPDGDLDYSESKNQFIRIDLLKNLAQFCNDVITASASTCDDYFSLLELANYCEAPKNVLFVLANKIWPDLQDRIDDTQKTKDWKKKLRMLVIPYLASPAHFLEYLQNNPTINLDELNKHDLNLSYKAINSLHPRKCNWLQGQDGLWYPHPLTLRWGSLKGLRALNEYLAAQRVDRRCGWLCISLSGHAITNFCLSELNKTNPTYETFTHFDLDHNLIALITGEQFGTVPFIKVLLNHNAIDSVDNSFYNQVHQWRENSKQCIISLQDNAFTEQQKSEIQKKLFKATHALPERLACAQTRSNIAMAIDLAITGTSTLATGYFTNRLLKNYSLALRIPAIAACSLVSIPTSFFAAIFATMTTELLVAKITHPKIGQCNGFSNAPYYIKVQL